MFEADDAFLKGKAKEVQALPNRQENHTEAQTDKRLRIYREHNPSVSDPKHLLAMFQAVIGQAACLTKVFGPPPEDKTP